MPIQKSDYTAKFDHALTQAQESFASLRTGRASAQLLDGVTVEAYGSRMAIHEVASVSAPDTQLLVIKPWDKSLLAAIEKGVQLAQLNLNPIIDGEIVRIVVPPLTQEMRQAMVKTLHQKAEEIKVIFRTVRSDVKRDIDKQAGESGVSEDDIKAEAAELDEVVKDYATQLEAMVKLKEKDLLQL